MQWKKKEYSYLGIAKSGVDEEGDGHVKIMFCKAIDSSAKPFKCVETDITYESYDIIFKINWDSKNYSTGKANILRIC